MNASPNTLIALRVAAIVLALCALATIPFGFSQEVLPANSWQVVELGGNRIWSYAVLTLWTVVRAVGIASICFVTCFMASAILVMAQLRVSGSIEVVASGMRFLPAVAWLPICISLIGVSNQWAILAFVSLGVGPVVVFHLLHGFRACPDEKLLVARLSNASRTATFLRIVLPNCIGEVLHALRLGLGLSFVLVVVYEYIFPSVAGVSRVVEILEVLRYSLLDSILFASILLCLGVILDQSCVLAFDVWRLRNKRTLDRKAV